MKRISLLFTILLFTTTSAFAQLTDFSLNVSKTDETCLSNGSLTMNVSGLTAGSTVIYKLYQLPNMDSPVSVFNENYIGGLSAGSYKVLAEQALNEFSNSQEATVTITSLIQPFSFTVLSENENCASGGSLIVNVTEGVADSYEIIAGPEMRPLQSSNVFNNLPSGNYNVRAFNECGIGKVLTYNLTITNSILSISEPQFSDLPSTACDSVMVSNVITSSTGVINYPLNISHALETMDISGSSVTIEETVTTGPADSLVVMRQMPRYIDDSYNYELRVTDACNTVFTKSDNLVSSELNASLHIGSAPCGESYLIVTASQFYNSFSIEFLSAPEGFIAADYNANQGPFTNGVVEFGSTTQSVPLGNYTIKVTDECGRESIQTLDVELNVPTPLVQPRNNGCFSEFGRIRIRITDSDILTAVVLDTDTNFYDVLPYDISGAINNQGQINLTNIPVGTYTLKFTDDCGFEYEREVVVPPFVEKPFTDATLAACEAGKGSVRLNSGNGDLTEVKVISAPALYYQSNPQDVSFNIVGGKFFMGSIPGGNYIFKATDECGIEHEMPVLIEGYTPPAENSFIVNHNCGGFSLKVTDSSNGLEGANYWLMRLDETTGQWKHPDTGVVYTEGDMPSSATAIRLNNNTFKHNLNFRGTFRILKKFETFSSGSAENTICISELGTFNYNDELTIQSAYTMACVGEPNSVFVEATGYPVAYRIIQRNGQPFTIDNGNVSIFKNLDPAEYVFSIEDACGNVVTQWFDFQELPSIAAASQPDDMIQCLEDTTGPVVFNLAEKNEEILGPLFSATYTISYHHTQADADNNENPLPLNYTSNGNGERIYVRLSHNDITICHSTTSFRLFVGTYQEPTIVSTGTVCNEVSLSLTAMGGYDSYLWSTGETTQTIYVDKPGLYTVIVEKAYGNAMCDGYAEIEVKTSEKPVITKVETKDWTREQNEIAVYVEGNGSYEYSVDGMNWQESNVFSGLETGVYTVYVNDIYGCGKDVTEVVLMHYPVYFTPNGDNVHDKWYIKYAIMEPDFSVSIFDRYGKHITSFGSTSDGWDGTLNGANLPSDDYWFVVTRQDGRVLKGHFAMVR